MQRYSRNVVFDLLIRCSSWFPLRSKPGCRDELASHEKCVEEAGGGDSFRKKEGEEEENKNKKPRDSGLCRETYRTCSE